MFSLGSDNVTLISSAMDRVNETVSNNVADLDEYTDVEMAFMYIAMVLLSLLTIVGNVAVFFAYFKTPDLQNSTNYFILSLATADLTIGIISINFYTVYLAYGYWPLGEILCDFWLSVDYWCCQASVLNLVVIAIDRYLSIKYPVGYRTRRTNKIVIKAIVAIWVLSFLLWVPWVVSYQYIQGIRSVPKDSCYIQFLYESWFITILTACFAYYGPILFIFILYLNIYFLLLQRKRKVGTITSSCTTGHTVADSTATLTISCRAMEESNDAINTAPVRQVKSDVPAGGQNRGLSEHKRAERLLILIISAFAITWLPYDVFAVIAPFCETCISVDWWHFGYIFCYMNSLINPICYAFGNKKFKKAFLRILFRSKE